MSAPTVPPGVNPWTSYIQTARETVYHTPNSGFRGRLIALICLTGLVTLLALVYLILLFVESRQVKDGATRRRLWLFRIARRNTGAYLICNTKLSCALLSIICGAVLIGYLVNQWNTLLLGKPLDQTTAWQTLQFVPILLQGWLITWSSLQAFLLATDHHIRPLLSPRWANGLFVGLGSVIILAATAIAIPNAIQGRAIWYDYVALEAQLKINQANWQEGDNILPQLLALQPLLDVLVTKGAYLRKLNIAELAIVATAPVIVIMVNLISLRLAMLIRTQINFNLEQCFGTQTTTLGGMSSNHALQYGSASRIRGGGGGGGGGGGAFENSVAFASNEKGSTAMEEKIWDRLHSSRWSLCSKHLTREELRYLATRRGSGPEIRDRIRGVQALQRAERDLVILAGTIMFALAAVTGAVIVTLVNFINTPNTGDIGWKSYETIQFALVWIYDLTMITVFLALITSMYSSRTLNFVAPTTDTLFTSSGSHLHSTHGRTVDSGHSLPYTQGTLSTSITSPVDWKNVRIDVQVEAKVEQLDADRI